MKKLNVAIIGQGRSGRDIHGAFFKSEFNEKFNVIAVVELLEETGYKPGKLTKLGSMAAVKDAGLLRSEGKEYVMKDGDVTYFLFNV